MSTGASPLSDSTVALMLAHEGPRGLRTTPRKPSRRQIEEAAVWDAPLGARRFKSPCADNTTDMESARRMITGKMGICLPLPARIQQSASPNEACRCDCRWRQTSYVPHRVRGCKLPCPRVLRQFYGLMFVFVRGNPCPLKESLFLRSLP